MYQVFSFLQNSFCFAFLACLDYFRFILPRSCLFQLVTVDFGFFHILYKKVKAHKACQNLETLEKVKARRVRKKVKARKPRKKMKARKTRKKLKARAARKKIKERKARKK